MTLPVISKMEQKELNTGDKIIFIPSTINFGRAEFAICPISKRGFIKELFIYRKQQEDKSFYHFVPFSPMRHLWFSSYQGLDEVYIWQMVWCKDHKCLSIQLYVPIGSHQLSVSQAFGTTIHFEFWR